MSETPKSIRQTTIAAPGLKPHIRPLQRMLRSVTGLPAAILAGAGQMLTKLGRIKDHSQQPTSNLIAVFYLTNVEASLIRQYLKLPERSGCSKFVMWHKLPREDVKALPEGLVDKIPKLRSLLWAFDPSSNAISLVEPSGNKVVAIL
jgi:hypothetical protein